MSFHRRTESVAGKDSLRQYGEIALCLIDRDGLPDLPAAVQDPVALMPGRMYLGLGRALWIGESSREGLASHHGGAVRGEDYVGHSGHWLQEVNAMAPVAID